MVGGQDFSVRSHQFTKVCESQVSVGVVVIIAYQVLVRLFSELFLKSRVPFSLLYIKSYNHAMNLLGISQFRGSSIINQCEVVLKLADKNRAIHLRAIKYGREVMFLIREFRCRRDRFGASLQILIERVSECADL